MPLGKLRRCRCDTVRESAGRIRSRWRRLRRSPVPLPQQLRGKRQPIADGSRPPRGPATPRRHRQSAVTLAHAIRALRSQRQPPLAQRPQGCLDAVVFIGRMRRRVERNATEVIAQSFRNRSPVDDLAALRLRRFDDAATYCRARRSRMTSSMGRSTSRRFHRRPTSRSCRASARRASGVYYTPPEIVAADRRADAGPLRRKRPLTSRSAFSTRPAARARFWSQAQRSYRTMVTRLGSLFGIDIDPAGRRCGRQRLRRQLILQGTSRACGRGDALVRRALRPTGLVRRDHRQSAVRQHPPARQERCRPSRSTRLRERYPHRPRQFRSLRAVHRAGLELLRPGGRCGLIVPNKWATLDYARPLPRAAAGADDDRARRRSVGTCASLPRRSVYPQVLVFRKERPRHRVHRVQHQSVCGRNVANVLQRLAVRRGHQLRAIARCRIARADAAARRTGDAVVRDAGLFGPANRLSVATWKREARRRRACPSARRLHHQRQHRPLRDPPGNVRYLGHDVRSGRVCRSIRRR